MTSIILNLNRSSSWCRHRAGRMRVMCGVDEGSKPTMELWRLVIANQEGQPPNRNTCKRNVTLAFSSFTRPISSRRYCVLCCMHLKIASFNGYPWQPKLSPWRAIRRLVGFAVFAPPFNTSHLELWQLSTLRRVLTTMRHLPTP